MKKPKKEAARPEYLQGKSGLEKGLLLLSKLGLSQDDLDGKVTAGAAFADMVSGADFDIKFHQKRFDISTRAGTAGGQQRSELATERRTSIRNAARRYLNANAHGTFAQFWAVTSPTLSCSRSTASRACSDMFPK